jgi:hypothetical protein
MAAWDDGRMTVIGTRRNRSHGHATLAVRIARTQTCQSVATATTGLVAPRPSTARWTVSAQNTAIPVQPPHRWVCSNTLWKRMRTGEVAPSVTTSMRPASTRHRASVRPLTWPG